MAENQSTTSNSKRRRPTDKFILSLKAAPAGKRITYWDADEPASGSSSLRKVAGASSSCGVFEANGLPLVS